MQKEKESQSNYKEMMEYKVKRLKEELEVANYLKDQSMSEKMKYIMNWWNCLFYVDLKFMQSFLSMWGFVLPTFELTV